MNLLTNLSPVYLQWANFGRGCVVLVVTDAEYSLFKVPDKFVFSPSSLYVSSVNKMVSAAVTG